MGTSPWTTGLGTGSTKKEMFFLSFQTKKKRQYFWNTPCNYLFSLTSGLSVPHVAWSVTKTIDILDLFCFSYRKKLK